MFFVPFFSRHLYNNKKASIYFKKFIHVFSVKSIQKTLHSTHSRSFYTRFDLELEKIEKSILLKW